MFATKVSRALVAVTVVGMSLVACKGHGSSSSIPQALTNWIWESGTDGANSNGYYDSKGSASALVTPAGRYSAMSWLDNNSQLWLFSGSGAPNDMWSFNPSALEWTWVSGNGFSAQGSAGLYPGVYPAPGGSGPTYTPGGRSGGATWTASSASGTNLWLFGGFGTDVNGLTGYMNDLWVYNTSQKVWTFVGGSSQAGNLAPVSSTQPNPRSNAAFWTGKDGMFYMFGGQGYLNNATSVQNDLWRYDPATNVWKLMGGTATQTVPGAYGTLATASATNWPGSRHSATVWTNEITGELWMYGGTGYDSQGSAGQLGDLWKFTFNSGVAAGGTWTWVSGPEVVNNVGNYGTNNVAASTNIPGARSGATGWIDSNQNLWLFGGYGINYEASLTVLNDLWEFTPSTNTWTWYNGSYIGGAVGYYGTFQSLSTANMPGSRYYANGWAIGSNFWLFGGLGYDAASTNGRLGDLWKFTP